MNDLDAGNELKEVSREILTLPDQLKPENENMHSEFNLATLIALAFEDDAYLFNDGKENAYAQYSILDHKEIWSINSKQMQRHLTKFGRTIKEGNIPSKTTISTAIGYLDSLACDGDEIELYNRVGKLGDDYFYDLSNKNWEAIKICKNGWEVSNNLPPLFKRQSHQKSQIKPINGGDIYKLLDFIHVPDNKKLLLLVYIVSCFIPDIPHPVLMMFGPQGSGKSMSMEFIRSLIDPSQTPRLKLPKSDREIIQNFDHHYCAFYDNLSNISGELSDMICRGVTGESSEQRSLYSNDDAVIRSYRRCIALNGINIAAEREDLLDRSILMQLKSFEFGKRLDENTLRTEFEKAIPSILGGILDTLVKAMNLYPDVKLENYPRMADFAKWGYAIAESLGDYGEEFLESYESDSNERILETVNSNPIALAILELMKNNNIWTGTATELLKELNQIVLMEGIEIENGQWAKDPARLVKKINRLQTILEDQGITYHNPKSSRKITFKNRESTVSTVLPLKIENDEENETLFTNHNSKNGKNGKNGKKSGIIPGSDNSKSCEDTLGEINLNEEEIL